MDSYYRQISKHSKSGLRISMGDGPLIWKKVFDDADSLNFFADYERN